MCVLCDKVFSTSPAVVVELANRGLIKVSGKRADLTDQGLLVANVALQSPLSLSLSPGARTLLAQVARWQRT